jgi:Transposase DDE domain
MAPGTTKPYRPPELPAGTINTTDPDSRLVKTVGQRALQGYNAQAAVNEHQIVVAAEVTVDSPDFGHLEPMVDATQRELAIIGAESPAVVVADAGYWHKRQMEKVVDRGIQVLIPPDSGLRKSARPGWDGGLNAFMRRVLSTDQAKALYRKRQTTIEPVFEQMKFNRGFDRFGAPRKIGLPLGMAAVRREPQPAQATQPPDSRRRGLREPRRTSTARDESPEPDPSPTATDEGSILLPPHEKRSTRNIQSISGTAGGTQWRGVLGTAGWLQATRFCPICRDFDGASRTRTGDLLGAIRARAGLESHRFAGLSASTRRVRPGRNARGLPAITGSLPPKTPLRGQTSAPSREVPPPTAALAIWSSSHWFPQSRESPPAPRGCGCPGAFQAAPPPLLRVHAKPQ